MHLDPTVIYAAASKSGANHRTVVNRLNGKKIRGRVLAARIDEALRELGVEPPPAAPANDSNAPPSSAA